VYKSMLLFNALPVGNMDLGLSVPNLRHFGPYESHGLLAGKALAHAGGDIRQSGLGRLGHGVFLS
jgi:hypothetical protein